MIMRASVRPTVTRKTATATEMSAWNGEYFCRASASTPPDDAATVRVTTGSNHTAVIACRECFCVVDLFIMSGLGSYICMQMWTYI